MKCAVYDNPKTDNRELWIDGELTVRIPRHIIRKFRGASTLEMPAFDSGRVKGDPSAFWRTTRASVHKEVMRQLDEATWTPANVFLGEAEFSAVLSPHFENSTRPYLHGLEVHRLKSSHGIFVA